MTGKKSKAAKEVTTIVANDSADRKGELKSIGGSQSDHWNKTLLNQALQSVWSNNADKAERDKLIGATLGALMGIGPKDELEGMMAAQLLAAHNASMESFRRSMLGNQTFEGRREGLNQANKLSRTWTILLDALNKHRGKGQQKVTVEHVHVHSGGQAVVGSVEHPGGGGHGQKEEQPHAQQISNAPQPTLRSKDTQREAVPITSNDK